MSTANNPNEPTNNADSQDSANKTGANEAGTNAGGDNTPKKPSIEEVPDHLKVVVNAAIASARRDGKEDGKKEAKREADNASDAERQKSLEENQEFKPLYESMKTKHDEVEKRAAAAEKELLQLQVALEKKLPNPTLAAKRLIGETKEELEADADTLLKVLKSDEAPEAAKAGDAAIPPATSQGGDDTKITEQTIESQQSSYNAQKALDIYNF